MRLGKGQATLIASVPVKRESRLFNKENLDFPLYANTLISTGNPPKVRQETDVGLTNKQSASQRPITPVNKHATKQMRNFPDRPL